MTKKPSHLHTTTEPEELEAPRADITGKEPVLVRDWDYESLVRAIRSRQRDIIDAELKYLESQPAWGHPAPKTYGHTITGIFDDVAAKFFSMCRLDNIPTYTYDNNVG